MGSVIQKYRSEHVPYLEAKRQKELPYHFHQVIDDASILDFKVASGIVRVKTVPGNTMTIEIAAWLHKTERVLRCGRIVRDREGWRGRR